MDEPFAVDSQAQPADPDPALLEEASTPYVGRWNRLVSTTNWEKGRIISEWRASLVEAGTPPQAWSDEAWSRRVGGVSPQHVGRLRRVHERFGQVHDQYEGLYWSHFQAALDWDDAEMWLEGAVHNGWSVATMRTTRWDALGAPADKRPKPEDVVTAELDEDTDPGLDESADAADLAAGIVQALLSGEVSDAVDTAESEATLPKPPSPPGDTAARESVELAEAAFSMPSDLARALKTLRVAILRHKREGWQQVGCEEVLEALEALRELASS